MPTTTRMPLIPRSSKFRLILFAAVLSIIPQFDSLAAEGGPPAPKFGPHWKTLIGEWKGQDSSGAPSGACGFHFDLADHVIVRTNFATLSGAATPHADLMIINPDAAGDKGRASYFDNEGHIIEYNASWSPDGKSLTFLSKPGPGPQFRLIYKELDASSFTVSFEMAPPGQTSAFRPYASGKISRR